MCFLLRRRLWSADSAYAVQMNLWACLFFTGTMLMLHVIVFVLFVFLFLFCLFIHLSGYSLYTCVLCSHLGYWCVRVYMIFIISLFYLSFSYFHSYSNSIIII